MDTPTTFKIMALHALEYCERLFYIEEVEAIYVQDDRVFAGRIPMAVGRMGDDILIL